MTRLLIAFGLAVTLSGCSIYRMDVAQGNFITQETVDQVKPGMTRSQVRFLLGTPMVTDPFHPDRWDYYYSFLKGSESKPDTRLVTVFFKGDVLTRIEGDVAPKKVDKP